MSPSPSKESAPNCGCLPSSLQKQRSKLHLLLNDTSSSTAALLINLFIMFIIVASTITFCLDTVVSLSTPEQDQIWFALETFFISIFTLEFLLRLLAAPALLPFVKSLMNWIDFLAIIPYYIELIVNAALSAEGGKVEISGLAAIRVIRLVRVFRLLKLGKQSGQLQQVLEAFRRSGEGVLLLLFLLLLSSVFFSSCIFFAETSICELVDNVWVYTSGPLQGEPTEFQSIFHSMWWCVVTITTVGYGDAYPVSPGGKVVAAFTIFGGLLTIAFPVTIIGSSLNEIYEEYRLKEEAVKKKKEQEASIAKLKERTELAQVADKKLHELMDEIKEAKGQLEETLKEIGEKVIKVRAIQERLDVVVSHAVKIKILQAKVAKDASH